MRTLNELAKAATITGILSSQACGWGLEVPVKAYCEDVDGDGCGNPDACLPELELYTKETYTLVSNALDPDDNDPEDCEPQLDTTISEDTFR